MKCLLLPLLVLIAVAGAWQWLHRPQVLPENLHLTFTDGNRSSIGQLRGNPFMLAFWSVNCSICLQDMPQLRNLHEQLAAQNIPVIAVSIPQDPPPAVMATVREFQPGYPTALDVQGDIASAVGGVDATPLNLFVDRQGRIVRRAYGKLDLDSARKTLSAL